MAAEEIKRTWTISQLEDGVTVRTRPVQGTFSAVLAQLQRQAPGATTSIETYSTDRATNLRRVTLTKGTGQITMIAG
jgi:hypothetical protein